MVRIGVVGIHYGCFVQIPALRRDPRCRVVALAASSPERASAAARASGICGSFGDWKTLVEDDEVDAVVLAVPPAVQSTIACHALQLGKPVLAEKPMAIDLSAAAEMLDLSRKIAGPAMIDFGFPEVPSWREAKRLLTAGGIGRLRHIFVNWTVENRAALQGDRGWKSRSELGGSALFNFASHSLHYLEWLCGPLEGLGARLSGLRGDDTTAVLSLAFASGAAGSLALSCASYLGAGHRLEIYGDDGTLVLANESKDYMRGFRLFYGRRPAEALTPLSLDEGAMDAAEDGRILPFSRIASRFIDAIENRSGAKPDFSDGYRVQVLLEAARQAHRTGRWIEAEARQP